MIIICHCRLAFTVIEFKNIRYNVYLIKRQIKLPYLLIFIKNNIYNISSRFSRHHVLRTFHHPCWNEKRFASN